LGTDARHAGSRAPDIGVLTLGFLLGWKEGSVMKSSNVVLRALLVFVAVGVIQIVAGMLFLSHVKTSASPHVLQWTLLSNALVAAALSIVRVGSMPTKVDLTRTPHTQEEVRYMNEDDPDCFPRTEHRSL
jgi:hypothetical protein